MKWTEDDIREITSETVYERGEDYWMDDRVVIESREGKKVKAVVKGSQNYRVEINLDDIEDYECSCPFEGDGACKHVVAVLLEAMDDDETAPAEEDEAVADAEELFAGLTVEKLKGFFLPELRRDQGMRERFFAVFSRKEGGNPPEYYRNLVANILETDMDSYGFIPYGEEPDLSEITELAETYSSQGNFREAAKIYREMFEELTAIMNNVDDSDGYYGSEIEAAVQEYVDCLSSANLQGEERKEVIADLFGHFRKADGEFWGDYLENALESFCQTADDWQSWLEILEPFVPAALPAHEKNWSEYSRAERLLARKIRLLELTGNTTEAEKLMLRHYRESSEIYRMLLRRLEESGRWEEAVGIAGEKDSNLHLSTRKESLELLVRYYENKDPVRTRALVVRLFLLKGNWEYYDRLKESDSAVEWKEDFAEIARELETDKHRALLLADVHLREGKKTEALALVLADDDLSSLREYREELAGTDPDAYYRAYRKHVLPQTRMVLPRGSYRQIAELLKEMKSIPGKKKELTQWVTELRVENKRKPAFLEEIANV
jgi:uncharacterized Zn finger protein